MSNKRFEVYKNQVFRLAKTLVFKYDPIRAIVDQGVMYSGYNIQQETAYESKYYLNLAGLAHPSDPEIKIRSIEDQLVEQFIDFNRPNLKLRATTRREYRYGSLFYNDLIRQFPDQESRIIGTIYPIVDDPDVNIAIAKSVEKAVLAEDGDILQWDRTLVEENETDLIPRLQNYIKTFLRRWFIPEYAITDEFYTQTMLGVLYSKLPSEIMNIRLSNCKTNRAHSFHTTEYLQSTAQLGEFANLLNTKQRLWVYRNLRYVQRNAGKTQTFKELVDILFTERRLPLIGYSLQHDLSRQPVEDYPQVKAVRENLNNLLNATSLDTVTTDYIVELQKQVGQENSFLVPDETISVVNQAKNSVSNNVKTKSLETVLVSNTNSDVYPLPEVLFNNWIYEAVQERFISPVFVNNPIDGTRLLLNTKDAFILYLYTYTLGYSRDNLGNPIILDQIPEFGVTQILRETPPTLNDLKSIVDPALVPESKLQEILNTVTPTIGLYLSVDTFYQDMISRRDIMNNLRNLYTIEEDFEVRGYMEFAVQSMYQDLVLKLTDLPMSYSDWFLNRGLDLTTITREQSVLLATEIMKAATVPVFSNTKIEDVQASMIRIMTKLSSYSVQFLKSQEIGQVFVEDAASLRFGRIRRNSSNVEFVAIPIESNFKTQGSIREKASIKVSPDTASFDLGYQSRVAYRSDVGLNVKAQMVDSDYIDIPISSLSWRVLDPDQIDLSSYPSQVLPDVN